MAVAEREPSLSPQPLPLMLHDWVTTVDHKRIGLIYIIASLVFLGIGGIEALVLRMQLMWPDARIVSPEVFNQFFTMHGTTMIFFVVMPILIGFANYIVPLQIGARDMAFPRVNSFSVWLFVFGGLLTYYSFATGGAPDKGWFGYAPLTEYTFSRSHATDYWILGLSVSGIGTMFGGINLITTILTMRCPA